MDRLGIDNAIDQAFRAGSAAHLTLALDRGRFAAFLGERAPTSAAAHAADLFLVCACLERVPRAVESFMSAYIERVPAFLGRRASSADLVSEVKQKLTVRLIVGENDRPPLLASFSGRGSLEGFVRVAAGRLAVDLQRCAARAPRAHESAIERELLADDVELRMLKDTYREPFRLAFGAAVRAVSAEQRALLRLHYVEGVTTAQLAHLRRVGRATVVRRLAEARAALVAGLQVELERRMGVDHDELVGLLRLVRSQLDLSLVRLLQETLG